MDRVEIESFWLICPAFADELVGREALGYLEATVVDISIFNRSNFTFWKHVEQQAVGASVEGSQTCLTPANYPPLRFGSKNPAGFAVYRVRTTVFSPGG